MYKRRVIVFLVLVLLVFLGLLVRLWELQVLRAADSRRAFEETQVQTEALPALRGAILDRRGNYLAKNVPCYDFCMEYGLMSGDANWGRLQQFRIARGLARDKKVSKADREKAQRIFQAMAAKSWAAAAEACGSASKRDDIVSGIVNRVENLIAHRRERPIEASSPHALLAEMDEKAANELRTRLTGTIGLTVRPTMKRYYPRGDTACHIIGVTGPVTAEERERLNDNSADELTRMREEYRLDDPIGQFGVEKLCETALRGVRGYRQTGVPGKGEVIEAAQDGKDVRLSIDAEMQEELAAKYRQMFSGRNGCVVLMDVKDGSVLTMLSMPTYDLRTYRQDYNRLVHDDYDLPLFHRAITRAYEPGSTAKPLAALAGLAAGTLTPQTTYVCQGKLYPDRNYLKCTAAHGPLDLERAIAKSCNVYFYHVGEKLERTYPSRLMAAYRQFGYGEDLGTGLAGESHGQMRSQVTVDEARMLAIGQGPITVTPLHVVTAMATIARRGMYISPTVRMDDRNQTRRKQEIPESVFDVVHRGMHGVCEPGGTAQSAFESANLGFEVCGKSGTAKPPVQWRDKNGDGRMQEDEILRKGNMVWFAGFAPYRDPQVAFVVLVEYIDWDEMGGGARVAAPFAIEALRACKARGYVK